ncbi:PREDICTED: uncharacterized protein LOC106746011 isoform X3 [Dinoponera quadriceps]|nr:PREDICTED: uncharacterized protein LOC106746011 isoform X3 [Dinoponera quadriceps]
MANGLAYEWQFQNTRKTKGKRNVLEQSTRTKESCIARGIPYGSVSGMLAKYPGYVQVNSPHQARQLDTFGFAQRPVIITPNLRANRPLGVASRPVQIYNLPAVVAPGIVGTISQIGY